MQTCKLLFRLLILTGLACGSPAPSDNCDDDCGSTADAAEPEIVLVTISVENTGDGEGVVLVNGEACEGIPCSRDVALGDTVSLEAQPTTTSSFGGWSNECASENVCEVVVDADQDLSLSFDVSGVLLSQAATLSGVTRSVVDANGNMYLLGTDRKGADNAQGYCAKLDPAGNQLWKVYPSFAEASEHRAVFLGLDLEGLPYAALEARGSFVTNRVYRLSPEDGAEVWGLTIRNVNLAQGQLVVDGLGNVFAFGLAINNARFGETTLINPSPVVLRNVMGVINKLGGVQRAALLPLIDGRATGIHGGRGLPAGGALVSRGTNAPGAAGLLERFSTAGEPGSSFDTPAVGQVALTEEGDVIVMNTYRSALNWGPEPELQAPDPGDGIFLGRFRADGTPVWLRTFTSPPNASADFVLLTPCLEVSAAGNIYGCGTAFTGQIDLGAGPLPAFADADGFAFSYSASGEYRWEMQSAGNGEDRATALAFTPDNTVSFFASHGAITTSLGPLPAGFGAFVLQR